jgi:hypothetical protein
MALKASEDGSVKNKTCDTDIDKEITFFKYTPDRLALPCARWCWSLEAYCSVLFWTIHINIFCFLNTGHLWNEGQLNLILRNSELRWTNVNCLLACVLM